jgi:apolipoprotein N-acyltransferase
MPWRRIAGAAAAGLLLTAALPPFGWWPLAIAGIALLVHLLEDEEARDNGRRLVVGYVAALALGGAALVAALAALVMGRRRIPS